MPRNIDETEDELSLPRAAYGVHRRRCLVHAYRAGDEAAGQRQDLTGARRVVIGRRPGPGGIELHDSRASREHAEVITEGAVARVVDRDSKNGTFVGGEETKAKELVHGDVIRVGSSLFVFVDAPLPGTIALVEPPADVAYTRAIAEATADLAAPTDLTVLIHGPTGSGKEVLARRIHAASGREGPFVALNCATLTRDLIGSELFGHTAGAFSGAVKARSGLFVAANEGTLLLDEIAELPLDQQAALLRVLQEKRVRPIGAEHEVPVDVRVIAATHQSLERMEAAGRFRADLHARLAGFVIELPGLSDRREEILPLFRRFLDDPHKHLTREAAEALLLYDWPHNVRELKHAAERARVLAQTALEIDLAHLPPALQRRTATPRDKSAFDTVEERLPKKKIEAAMRDRPIDRAELEKLLDEHGGNVAQICRATGKHRQQIYRLLEKHGIDLGRYRPEGETESD